MSDQDRFYREKESDAFFDRWQKTQSVPVGELRPGKQTMLAFLERNLDLQDLHVLEIGCFIGDLLTYLQTHYQCQVQGIEPSQKACDYAQERFGLALENTTLATSHHFQLTTHNRHQFDLVLCDDILSWISRDLILPCLGVLDWLLKPGGHLFFRDFSPPFAFAYENHHWPGAHILNFKQPGGHRQFFLATGQYLEKETSLRLSEQFQHIQTTRPDSLVWSDTLLLKLESPLHPVVPLS